MFLRNSVDEIAFCPELSMPEECFDVRMFLKDFTDSDAFYDLGYFGWTIHGY